MDDQYIVAGVDKKVIVRNRTSGEVVFDWEHDGNVYSIAMDDQYIVAGGEDNKVIVRNRTSGEVVFDWEHVGSVNSIAMDDQYIVASGEDNKVIVRNRTSGEVVFVWKYSDDLLYFDEELNAYFCHKERNEYLKIDYNTKVYDWDACGQEKLKYVHDNRCEYFILKFSLNPKTRETEKQCLFYYNTKDDEMIRPDVRINFNMDKAYPDPQTAWCQKIFFQKRWTLGRRSRDNLLNCFAVQRNAAQNLSEANCFDPLLTKTGTDREWIRSMEQKYAQSESIKYVLDQNNEITNLILNA